MIETDVLIVGSGPAGSSAAALLSTYGVDNVLVTKYRWLADTPRAHITNQRTMEVLRDLGVEAEAMLHATPNHLMGNNVFCISLAGEELGRMRSWGAHPMTQARHKLASPTTMVDLPQTFIEPILFKAACARGTKARLSTEYLSLEQDAQGVTATVRDRVSGESYPIRCPCRGRWASRAPSTSCSKRISHATSLTDRAFSIGYCSPAATSAASAWVSSAWSGRGMNGCSSGVTTLRSLLRK
jgi:2-polyprenyl-6-methoxyphenol hydroxylase-like FAD-dependent oxidoreductase